MNKAPAFESPTSSDGHYAGNVPHHQGFLVPLGISRPLALSLLLAGFAAALLTLPQDVEPRMALRLPSLLMALGIGLPVVAAALAQPKTLFRAECVVVLSPIFWLLLDPLQARYDLPGLELADVQQSLLAIALFVAGVWLATLHPGWGPPRWLRDASNFEFAPNTWFTAGILAFALAFLRFAIPSGFDLGDMFGALGGGRWEAPWSRGDLGGPDAFLDHFSYFGFLLPVLTVMLARKCGWMDARTIILMLLAVTIALFIGQGGGRRIIGVLFGSAAAFWFLSQTRVRGRVLFLLAVTSVVLLMSLEFMLDYRNVGWKAYFDSDVRAAIADDKVTENALIRVDDNFYRLGQITALFPEEHPYVTWKYLLWVVVRPVPRVLWPGKPLDAGFDLPELVDVQGVSLSASTIGELFAAGGLIAVFLGGLLYGCIAGLLSRMVEESGKASALAIYSLGLLALFAGMRSMIELVLMSYGIIAWAIIGRFIQIWRGKAPAPENIRNEFEV